MGTRPIIKKLRRTQYGLTTGNLGTAKRLHFKFAAGVTVSIILPHPADDSLVLNCRFRIHRPGFGRRPYNTGREIINPEAAP